jgi:hypothetical protein
LIDASSAHQGRGPGFWLDRRNDLLALAVLFAGIGIVAAHRFYYDNWLARHDLLTFFLPWHGLLGERLGNFDIPGWNPGVFAGTPFLGDPESGWLYFPAMVVFPFLKITVALKAMILIQLLIGGSATYSLGRVIGFGALGALASAASFTFGPFLIAQTDCCTVGAGLSAWLPVAFLGIEIGLRCRRWLHRLAAWAISGVAISQMLAVWLGQGAAIGLLMVAAWIGYRGMIDPPVRMHLRQRIEETVIAGLAVFGCGIGLAAGGLLPRLMVNSESTIQGGDYTNAPGARDENPISVPGLFYYLFQDNRDTRATALGGVVATLAILAVVLSRRRYAVPYFLAMEVGIAALATPRNVVQDMMFLIPRFEELQIHSPTRVFWAMSILPAMLVGAGMQGLLDNRGKAKLLPLLAVPLLAISMIRVYLEDNGRELDASAVAVAWIATGLAAIVLIPWIALGMRWRERMPRLAAVALILLVFAWPNVPEVVDSVRHPNGTAGELKLWGKDAAIEDAVAATLASTDPGGAGEFFQALRDSGEIFRYVSYAGNGSEFGPNLSAPARRLDPNVIGLLVNGRPMQLNLQQVSGYNPLQMLEFLRFLAVANGRYQDYHHADVFATAAGSPLIDMLNVEYFVVDASLNPTRDDVLAFSSQGEEVFRNDQVIVYRNASAFERGWIVHDVRPTDAESLVRLNSGEFDGKTVAFVEDYDSTDFPVAAATGSPESVIFESYEADAMRMTVTASADGLLVLSEVHATGWKAFVDGKETRIYRTNGALRGIPVSAGEREVELRYEPRSLTIGMWTTTTFGVGAIAIWSIVAVDWLRRHGK